MADNTEMGVFPSEADYEKLNIGDASGVLVTIWCTVYNQKEYIRDALNGFLIQETTFKFEVIHLHNIISSHLESYYVLLFFSIVSNTF